MHAGVNRTRDGTQRHSAAAPGAPRASQSAVCVLQSVRLSAFFLGALYASGIWASDAAQPSPLAVSPISTGVLVQVTIGLGAVLALILVMAWLLRRFGPLQAGGRGTVRLLGGVSLGQRERAVLVQVGDKQLLLGVAPGNVRTLHVFDAPEDAEAAPSEDRASKSTRSLSGGFAERLQAALSERIRR